MSVVLTIHSGSGSGTYTNYATVGISAWSPPAGHHFGHWTKSGAVGYFDNYENSSTNVHLAGPGNGECTANYQINTYTLTYAATAGGSITGSTPQYVVYGGSGTEVHAAANSGYHFTKWGDGSLDPDRTDTNVDQNISETAEFAANTPTITSLGTIVGPSIGGTSVVINGTYFTSASSVKFGTTEAASFTVDTAIKITAVTPAHAIGLVDVSVTAPGGTATKTNAFTFNQAAADVSGTITPTGALTKRAITCSMSGTVSISGSLSGTGIHESKDNILSLGGSVTISGRLFAYILRPKTLYAPFVPTTLGAP